MKIALKARWIQNFILAVVLAVVMIFVFLLQDTIAGFSSPSLFFYAVLITFVLASVSLFLFITINTRATAIANARTAGLLETQQLFVELYRNSPVPYVMIDGNGRVTYPNHAANRIFNLQEASFEGRNIFDMFQVADDEDGMKTALLHDKFKQGVFVEATDVVLKRDDQTTRYGLLSIFPYGQFGTQKNGLMTIVDITKQKQIEKSKSEFVSLASHQLRTPVSAMKWNLELMRSPQFGTLSEGQVSYVTKIQHGLERMNGLIEDFLNVSHLELGTKRIEIDRMEVRPFFDSICEEFEGRVAEKNLTIDRRFDDRVSAIETDKSLLHMVVSNLVSNATKYTNEGGTIVVQYVGGADTLTIAVIDNGMGIPADDQERLFTKFFRAENVRANVKSGTGLGLYIVKLAVEKLGGTIRMKSEEGVGTEFDITLPYSSSGFNK